jgi:hypothetical protein
LWGKQAKYIGKIVRPESGLQVEELKNLRRIEVRVIPSQTWKSDEKQPVR